MRGLHLWSLLLSTVGVLSGQEFQELQGKVSEFTLSNGLRFIVLERHGAPVVSFHTLVKVGSVYDPAGETGMSRMFERLAFKGTDTIGTRNWAEEKKALDAIEEACNRLEAEVNKGIKADAMRLDVLRSQVRVATDNALRLSASGEYRRIIEENGGVELSVVASNSTTQSSYSLPSNRAELWFLMESQRLLHPVLRDFYRERDAALEEYGQRREGNAQTRLVLELLATAFKAHPYGHPPAGWPSDIANLRSARAQEFFERYYVPGNVTMAIVGDIAAAEAKRLAERYFGPWGAKPLPPLGATEEPAQDGPKSVVLEQPGQPFTIVGYKRPSQNDKDGLVFELLQILLAQGLSGLLYDEFVREKRVAQQAAAIADAPEDRFPCMFLVMLTPAPGRTVQENQRALEELLSRLKSTPLATHILARAKAQGRANLIRRINSNRELAMQLAYHASSFGDWRRLFTSLDALDRVKPEDVQRVVARYFVATGRTTAYSVPPGQSSASPPARPAEGRPGGAQ